MTNYELIFDEVMIKQLKKAAKNQHIKILLTKIFDKVEEKGSEAGDLIDSQLNIYEVKMKHPPIRLYYLSSKNDNKVYVFEYEMKTSQEKQQNTIDKIKDKAKKLKP